MPEVYAVIFKKHDAVVPSGLTSKKSPITSLGEGLHASVKFGGAQLKKNSPTPYKSRPNRLKHAKS